MKVRIGVSLGPAGTPAGFASAVDLLEQAGVDSLWLPENVYSPAVEPFTGMAFALSRTRKLKVGTGISVLPGRHPVLVAKQLASIAGLAPRRVLPVFGLQPAQPAERVLFGVPEGQRAAVFDEALILLRLMLTQEWVSFEGSFFSVSGASVGVLPAKPLDIWLGASAPAGLRRVGRLADGWLGSLLTPAEAQAAVTTITECLWGQLREVGAKVSASLLYPSTNSPGMLNTGIWRPGANRPDRYDRPGAAPREGRDALGSYLKRMEEAGHEVVFAPLSEVADICFEGIVNDTFWITAPSAAQQQKIRDRATSQIEMTPPDYLLAANMMTSRPSDAKQ